MQKWYNNLSIIQKIIVYYLTLIIAVLLSEFLNLYIPSLHSDIANICGTSLAFGVVILLEIEKWKKSNINFVKFI